MKTRKKSTEAVAFDDVAIAVKYQFGKEGEAPKVVASGRGHIAAQILDIARHNRIPVEERPELADSLAKVPVGVEIPAELWEAMAEVLAHIYSLDGSRRNV